MARVEGDADRGADAHADLVDDERLVQRPLEQLGAVDRGLVVGRHDHDAELVAAEAGEQAGVADHGPEPVGDQSEQLVAGVVTERVVDLLEAVEVDDHHGDRARGHLDQPVEPLEEAATVGERGELVGARQPVALAAGVQFVHRDRGAQDHGRHGGEREQRRHEVDVVDDAGPEDAECHQAEQDRDHRELGRSLGALTAVGPRQPGRHGHEQAGDEPHVLGPAGERSDDRTAVRHLRRPVQLTDVAGDEQAGGDGEGDDRSARSVSHRRPRGGDHHAEGEVEDERGEGDAHLVHVGRVAGQVGERTRPQHGAGRAGAEDEDHPVEAVAAQRSGVHAAGDDRGGDGQGRGADEADDVGRAGRAQRVELEHRGDRQGVQAECAGQQLPRTSAMPVGAGSDQHQGGREQRGDEVDRVQAARGPRRCDDRGPDRHGHGEAGDQEHDAQEHGRPSGRQGERIGGAPPAVGSGPRSPATGRPHVRGRCRSDRRPPARPGSGAAVAAVWTCVVLVCGGFGVRRRRW